MQSLETYSLIKALFDERRDYLDAFWPFVVFVLPRDRRAVEVGPIADEVLSRFGLQIPQHTVRTLLERARRWKSLVVREHNRFSLTVEGIAYLKAMESEREVQRRVNALVDDASSALSVQFPEFESRDFTRDLLTALVQRNSSVFEYLGDKRNTLPTAATPTHESAVLDYFAEVERTKPQHFATLRDLVLGSTIAGLLKREDIDLNETERNFQATELYLDSNYTLSLLGLRFEAESRPAQELLAMLQRTPAFSLFILDITLEEIVRLLRGYEAASVRFPTSIRVKDIYASMRYLGWTPSDVSLLIGDLEDRLSALGITVVRSGYELKTEVPEIATRHATLTNYKADQDVFAQRHDAFAIEFVTRRRGRAVRKVEAAKAFLLTEDYRLSNYAFVELSHRTAGTINEVMPDRLLTNLLWLKEPNVLQAVPMATVIALHSRDLLVDKDVWLRFHEVLGQLIDSGDLPTESAAYLLYDAQVNRDLVALGRDPTSIQKPWVLELAGDAQARAEQRQAEEVRATAEALVLQFGGELSEAEDRHRTELSRLEHGVGEARGAERTAREDLRTAKGVLTADAKKESNAEAKNAIVVVRFVVAGICIAVLLLPGVSSLLRGPVGHAIVTITVVAGIELAPAKLYKRLELWFAGRFLTRRLATIDKAFPTVDVP